MSMQPTDGKNTCEAAEFNTKCTDMLSDQSNIRNFIRYLIISEQLFKEEHPTTTEENNLHYKEIAQIYKKQLVTVAAYKGLLSWCMFNCLYTVTNYTHLMA